MTFAQARFSSQVDCDRQEAFNRHDYGLPYVSWLYWHSPNKAKRWKAPDPDAPYADPITGGMRKLDLKMPPRAREARVRPDPPSIEPLPSEFDPIVVKPRRRRVDPEAAIPFVTYQGDHHIEDLSLPVDMRVPRETYLAHIRQLMKEWKIDGEAQFNLYRESLIKHALFRMGRLP